MVHQRLSPLLLSDSGSSILIISSLIRLQDRVERTLLGLHLFMSDMLDMGGRLAEGLFRTFIFLVHVHLCLPGVDIALALIEDHVKFH